MKVLRKKVVGGWVELGLALLSDLTFWLLSLLCLEDHSDVLSEDLAQFDTPLIETVDPEQEALHGHSMLVECEQLTAFVGVQGPQEQETQTGSVSKEELVLLHGGVGHALTD